MGTENAIQNITQDQNITQEGSKRAEHDISTDLFTSVEEYKEMTPELSVIRVPNINESRAVDFAKEAFLADSKLDSPAEIKIFDVGMYHSQYTNKSWWLIKLGTNIPVQTYIVDADDGSISTGWSLVESYEQEFATKNGKISPIISKNVGISNTDTKKVIVVLKDQPNIREITKYTEGLFNNELNESFESKDNAKINATIFKIRSTIIANASIFNIEHGQESVSLKITSLNGQIIYQGKLRNHIIANMSIGSLEDIAKLPEVVSIEPDQISIGHLDISTKAINADDVWPRLNGNTFTSNAGVVNEVSIFDSGVDCSHPALDCEASWNYVSDQENTVDDLQGHGTHVAGIVASNDATYRGVSSGARILNEKIAYRAADGSTYSPDSATIEALQHSYSYQSEVVQYSYGRLPLPSDYAADTQGNSEISKTFDAYVEAGLASVISAGNNGQPYSTINVPGDAYNVITVGNFDDMNTEGRSDDSVYIDSSRGYTGDLRTKPDVSAPGSNIMSCNTFWESTNDFIPMWGTSMAAPHVSGIAALLVDEWARQYSERLSGTGFVYGGPLAIRAIIYNSADETTGENTVAWNDRISGTGYVDAHAAIMNQASKNLVKILNVGNAANVYQDIYVYPGNVIKATVVWNRHVDIDTITPKSVSDIDLDLETTTGVVLASSQDGPTNWEKISYTHTGSPTTLRIRVNGFSVPTAVGSETVALAFSTGTGSSIVPDKIGVFRNGPWYLDYNGNRVWDPASGDVSFWFGTSGDLPLAGDWNGDGKDEIGVFRNGPWYLDYNGNRVWDPASGDVSFWFGTSGDLPLAGDWNGDGKDEIGVFRNGPWYLDYNGNRVWDPASGDVSFWFGTSGDLPVAGDWNGDGKDEIGVFRNGPWYLDYNGNRVWDPASGDVSFWFGTSGDKPVAGYWN